MQFLLIILKEQVFKLCISEAYKEHTRHAFVVFC